jgi:cell division protein FtsZ
MGILTVAVVTRPFAFEGKRRLQQAERGMAELLESVDTMIVIPNEKLLAVAKDAGFFESFRIADDVLRQGVQGISDIITIPGIINRDFADVKTTMAGMGHAVMGTAVRSGANRAIEAAQAAMASPLLEEGAIDGARGILINITGSSSLKLSEVNEASSLIQTSAHEDANIIFGAVLDEKMGEEVKITVIATGFRDQMPERRARMLDVERTPVVSVPVVAPDSWMNDSDSAPLRFMSELEEAEDSAETSEGEQARLASSAQESGLRLETGTPVPVPATNIPVESEMHVGVAVAVAESESISAHEEPSHEYRADFRSESRPESALAREFAARFAHEPDVEAVPAPPRFAELAEPPAYLAPATDDNASEHPDLDVPAFLRRGQF